MQIQGTRACQASDVGFLITTAGTRATSLVDKMHYCKIMERERVSPQISAFQFSNGWNKRDIFS
jgi:hypothetical protein